MRCDRTYRLGQIPQLGSTYRIGQEIDELKLPTMQVGTPPVVAGNGPTKYGEWRAVCVDAKAVKELVG